MHVNKAAQLYVDNRAEYDCTFYGNAPTHIIDQNRALLADLRNNGHYLVQTSQGFVLRMENSYYREVIPPTEQA